MNLQASNSCSDAKTVYLLEDKVILPMSDVIVLAKVTGIRQKNQMGIIESEELGTPGLVTVDVLVKTKKKDKVPVRIMNVTMNAVKLRKQESIGKFLQATEETEEQADSRKSVKTDAATAMTKKDFGNILIGPKWEKTKRNPC